MSHVIKNELVLLRIFEENQFYEITKTFNSFDLWLGLYKWGKNE